jgi:hypothetical protein
MTAALGSAGAARFSLSTPSRVEMAARAVSLGEPNRTDSEGRTEGRTVSQDRGFLAHLTNGFKPFPRGC